jgi:hypothetical protein
VSIDAIKSVDAPLGEGGRSWYPYMVRSEISDAVAGFDDPVALLAQWLETERDPLWCEVVLFLLAAQDDARVDAILVDALADPRLRPRALYLIGAIGTRGWPKRDRDVPALLRAVRPWTSDATTYVDPVHEEDVVVGDLAKAAFIRLAGPERFPALERAANPRQPFPVEHVGMAIAHYDDQARDELQAEIDRF